MSDVGPPTHVVVGTMLAAFAVAAALALGAAHLLFLLLRGRFPERALRRGFLAGALAATLVAAVLMVAEWRRVMLLPDGQNEEGAFVALAVAAGLKARALLPSRKAPPTDP